MPVMCARNVALQQRDVRRGCGVRHRRCIIIDAKINDTVVSRQIALTTLRFAAAGDELVETIAELLAVETVDDWIDARV